MQQENEVICFGAPDGIFRTADKRQRMSPGLTVGLLLHAFVLRV
jgi:hypothetical protein